MFADVYERCGVQVPDLPADVEVLPRHGEDGTRYVVVLNHTEQEQHLTVPGTDQEVGVGAGESLTLPVPA